MPDATSSMRRDLLSAYAASLARVGSWAVVSAVVFRQSPMAFALLALVRGTIGILNYASLGLMPAMVRAFAGLDAAAPLPVLPIAPEAEGAPLAYAGPRTDAPNPGPPGDRLFRTGMLIAFVMTAIGAMAAFACSLFATSLYSIPAALKEDADVARLVAFFGLGVAVRWLGDPSSAYLQTHGRLTLDNTLQAISDALWAGAVVLIPTDSWQTCLLWVGIAYLDANVLLAVARGVAAKLRGANDRVKGPDWTVARTLIVAGGLITLAQLADFLYAPTDYILINRLLSTRDLADYAPAVQIDASLMILVTGLSAVLLPKAALAFAAGDHAKVKRYYVIGTLATGGMLAVAGTVVWLASPLIFHAWLGHPLPGAQAILPLMMIHLVVGGSSAVGRSILVGIGKVKPLTIAVLIGGASNVLFSYAFVKYGHLGLRGIVLGTIVAVVARCAIWMPWYVGRELKRAG